MATRQVWTALVTFARGEDTLNLLPDWAEGASGWMAAIASRADEAHALLLRDLEASGFQQIEVKDIELVDAGHIVDERVGDIVDEQLASNVSNIEPGKQTVWGTLHCWVGDGEA